MREWRNFESGTEVAGVIEICDGMDSTALKLLMVWRLTSRCHTDLEHVQLQLLLL